MELRLCAITLAYPMVSGYMLWRLSFTHTTPIKWADYKTPKELRSSKKLNISHLWVFGCLAWVHILKRGDINLSLRAEKWSLLDMNQDQRDTSSGMQPTNALKFPMMWNSKKLTFLQKKWIWHSQLWHHWVAARFLNWITNLIHRCEEEKLV